MPYPRKFDVEMSERLFMRLTAEQKARLQQVTSEYTGGTADFWRGVLMLSADIILKEQKGEISQEEMKALLSEKLTEFVVTSGVVKVEHEPET